MLTVHRYHDFSCAHRSPNDPGKCFRIHGHNYRVHFTAEALGELTDLGRVVDFAIIKTELCEWLENNWDHKLLLWSQDPLYVEFVQMIATGTLHTNNPLNMYGMPKQCSAWLRVLSESVQAVSFDTSTENMAKYLLELGSKLLAPYNARLSSVRIEETRKCGATADNVP